MESDNQTWKLARLKMESDNQSSLEPDGFGRDNWVRYAPFGA